MSRKSPDERAALRPDLVAAGGLALAEADRQRIADTVAGSLKALDAVASASIFDTEPSNFDRLLASERPGAARRTGGAA